MSKRRLMRYGLALAGCLAWAWPAAAAPPVEAPGLPLPPAPFTMPHLPPTQGNKPLQPRLVLPETLDGPFLGSPPPAPALPAGERVRVPSADVKEPVPLPILGQPLSDRAPIEDVTGEASSASAVAAPLPRRTQPTPFVKNNLPDPFEFRRPVVPAKGAEEQPTPPAASPKLPRP